jgi:hypothetical protein
MLSWDTAHLLDRWPADPTSQSKTPTPGQTADLAGGVYDIQHNAKSASFLQLPMAPGNAFKKTCGICR